MPDVVLAPATVLFEAVRHRRAQVTVAITLHDYAEVVGAALDSVLKQELADLDLVIVDDCSQDGGDRRALAWLQDHAARFGRCALLQHRTNQGLAATRNQGFGWAATPFVFVLDADNEIYPRCLQVCLDTALARHADAVYTLLEVFGEARGVMGTDLWDPAALQVQNYIDAMALIRRAAWQAVGGYRRMPANGWEDYDFWLKFVEAGLDALRVPELLCRYRKHSRSMLRTVTDRSGTIDALHDDMRLHHPDIRLPRRFL